MDDSYTIQISSNLVRQLAEEAEKPKKKTRRPKTGVPGKPQQSPPKTSQKQISGNLQPPVPVAATTGWPLQPPLFLPVPPLQQSSNSELEAIRAVLQESEKVVERLQKKEEEMVKEVTERAKDLHEKEFTLPYQKPMPCLADYRACLECYKENGKDPLKCTNLVTAFADCVRLVRQQVHSANK